jgi:hypothetical protein
MAKTKLTRPAKFIRVLGKFLTSEQFLRVLKSLFILKKLLW